jgi:transcriptional regulator with XRE-family HTH domain
MNEKKKKEVRKLFGEHLQRQRENILKIDSVRQLSFASNLDQSKLSKIEKGQIDVRFDTLLEIALTYKLKPQELFHFDIPFWKTEE